MKIQRKKSTHKIIIVSIIIIGVAFLCGVSYFVYANFIKPANVETPVESQDTSSNTAPAIDTPSTNEQIKDGQDIKKDTINENKDGTQSPESTVAVTIIRAEQTKDKLTVEVRVLIETVTSGSCTLTATNDGKKFVSTVDVQSLSSSSTCKGFDIPVSKLGSGSWSISVSYSSQNQNGAASVANIPVM